MESRFEDVGHWPMRSIGRLFLGAMLAVPLAFYGKPPVKAVLRG